jgi:hypothetical protein
MTKETLEEDLLNTAIQVVGDNNITTIKEFLVKHKWQQERRFSELDMIEFVEFVALYPDKNRNHKGEILHAKSKYNGAERTIDLLQIWFQQFKKNLK